MSNDKDFRDWLAGRLDRLESTQVEIKSDLSEHMRRTELNEEVAKLAREEVAAVRAEIAPIKMHVAVVGAIFKAVIGLGTLAGAIYSIAKLLSI